MSTDITVLQAALINGDSDGTYRALLSTAERKASGRRKPVGAKRRGERRVNFGETLLLRTTTEMTSGNVNVHEAFARALGLMPYITGIVTKRGPLGDSGQDVFAVDVWGLLGADPPRVGYVCQGGEALAECIVYLAKEGWPNTRTVNLSRLIAEVVIGWNMAAHSVDKASEDFFEHVERMTKEDATTYAQIFSEMKRRLGGNRRAGPAATGEWRVWAPLPNVAAAAMSTLA